jgi:hypothetical protein
VSVIEPSDVVNAGMAVQTEGRRFALSRKSLPSVLGLVGFSAFSLRSSTLEDGMIVCPETSVTNCQPTLRKIAEGRMKSRLVLRAGEVCSVESLWSHKAHYAIGRAFGT